MEPFPPRTPLTLSYAGQIARQRHFIKLPSILYLRFAIVNAWKERPVVEDGQRRRPCEMVAREVLPLRPAPAARSLSGAPVEDDSADVVAVGNCHARKTRGYRNRGRESSRRSGRGRGRGGRTPDGSWRGSSYSGRHQNAAYPQGRKGGWSGEVRSEEHNPRILGSDDDGMGVLPEEVGIEFSGERHYSSSYGGIVEENEEGGWVTVARRKKEKERRAVPV